MEIAGRITGWISGEIYREKEAETGSPLGMGLGVGALSTGDVGNAVCVGTPGTGWKGVSVGVVDTRDPKGSEAGCDDS